MICSEKNPQQVAAKQVGPHGAQARGQLAGRLRFTDGGAQL